MSVILHGAAYSVYVRIARLALAEKGVACELREVDIFAEGGPGAGHMARHPFGKIPVFEHDGFMLYETSAICRYVDDAFEGPSLLPGAAKARARVAQVIGLLDSYGYRPMVWEVYVPLSGDGAPDNPDPQAVACALERSEIVLCELERLAGEGLVLNGDEISLADLHAAPMLAYFMATAPGREAVANHPRLSAWATAMRRRPSVEETRPPEAAW